MSISIVDGSGHTLVTINASVLSGWSFNGLNLAGAQLSSQDLTFCSFVLCNLQGANFNSAILNYADFLGADLSGATFVLAGFSGTRLPWCNLQGTDFTNVNNDTLVPAYGKNDFSIIRWFSGTGQVLTGSKKIPNPIPDARNPWRGPAWLPSTIQAI